MIVLERSASNVVQVLRWSSCLCVCVCLYSGGRRVARLQARCPGSRQHWCVQADTLWHPPPLSPGRWTAGAPFGFAQERLAHPIGPTTTLSDDCWAANCRRLARARATPMGAHHGVVVRTGCCQAVGWPHSPGARRTREPERTHHGVPRQCRPGGGLPGGRLPAPRSDSRFSAPKRARLGVPVSWLVAGWSLGDAIREPTRRRRADKSFTLLRNRLGQHRLAIAQRKEQHRATSSAGLALRN